MRVLSAHEMREMDRRTTEEFGVSSLQLMELAGKAVADVVNEFLKQTDAGKAIPHSISTVKNLITEVTGSPKFPFCGMRIAVVCGGGNNGGDGLVAARHLANMGHDVVVVLDADINKLKGDAKKNYEALKQLGSSVIKASDADTSVCIETASIIVDALMGIGLRGDLMESTVELVEMINDSLAPTISVDIPTGINADTGAVCGDAVVADITVTFSSPKLGHVLYPGADYCGDLMIADIGIPLALQDLFDTTGRSIITPAMVFTVLPSREPDSHKGYYGHAGMVAGSTGMAGAAEMAGKASALIGAGLTTVAVPHGIYPIVASKFTEIMTHPFGQPGADAFTYKELDQLLELSEDWTAVGIGCGLGQADPTINFVKEFVRRVKLPIVIDADGLNCLGKDAAKILPQREEDTVITPHPGEMARLLGTDTDWVQSNRLEAACKAADDFACVCVLKGAHTIVAINAGHVFFNLTGNAGMAKGGSGDVLTGIILGLMAQGLNGPGAAMCGVWMHGTAADIAVRKKTENALLASDCLAALPEVFQLLEHK